MPAGGHQHVARNDLLITAALPFNGRSTSGLGDGRDNAACSLTSFHFGIPLLEF